MELLKLKNIAQRSLAICPDFQKQSILNFIENPSQELFQLIPSIQKKDIFENKNIIEYLITDAKNNSKKIILSAGSSNSSLSFRYGSKSGSEESFKYLSVVMQNEWKISTTNTFVLNCYPTGSTLPSEINSIDIGSRIDLISKIVNMIKNNYQNFIIVGFPSVISWCLANNMLPDNCYFVTGGERTPSYLIKQISDKINCSETEALNRVISLYGLAEIGLGLGINSPLIRSNLKTTSTDIYAVNSKSILCESVNNEILLTSYADDSIPLLRYQTGDLINYFTHNNEFNSYIFSYSGRKSKLEIENKIKCIEKYITDNYQLISKSFVGLKAESDDNIYAIYSSPEYEDILSKYYSTDGIKINKIFITHFDPSRKGYGSIYTA